MRLKNIFVVVLFCVGAATLMSCGDSKPESSLSRTHDYEVVCYVSNSEVAELVNNRDRLKGFARLGKAKGLGEKPGSVRTGAPSPGQGMTVWISGDDEVPEFIFELYWLGESDFYAGAVLIEAGASWSQSDLDRYLQLVEPYPKVIPRQEDLPRRVREKYAKF